MPVGFPSMRATPSHTDKPTIEPLPAPCKTGYELALVLGHTCHSGSESMRVQDVHIEPWVIHVINLSKHEGQTASPIMDLRLSSSLQSATTACRTFAYSLPLRKSHVILKAADSTQQCQAALACMLYLLHQDWDCKTCRHADSQAFFMSCKMSTPATLHAFALGPLW